MGVASYEDVRHRLTSLPRGICGGWVNARDLPAIIATIRKTACAALWSIKETEHINSIIKELAFKYNTYLPIFIR